MLIETRKHFVLGLYSGGLLFIGYFGLKGDLFMAKNLLSTYMDKALYLLMYPDNFRWAFNLVKNYCY